jgi:hypothetical protein
MKKTFAALTLAALIAPVAALAESDTNEQAMFMLGRMAAVYAIERGLPISCGVTTSKAVVRVGEPYQLIWNSYGANDLGEGGQSQLAPRGIQTMLMQQSGTFLYKMPFYGKNGAQATCTTKITILP